MEENKIYTNLTILPKGEVNIKRYFESLKRNLSGNWKSSICNLNIDKLTFEYVNDSYDLISPYYKNKDNICRFKYSFCLTDEIIFIIKINIEYINTDYKPDERENIEGISFALKILNDNVLSQNKYFENFIHNYEFGGPIDDNYSLDDIRDFRKMKIYCKTSKSLITFANGAKCDYGEKKIIYFPPNNIALTLNLAKKSFKTSYLIHKSIVRTNKNLYIDLSDRKNELYNFFEEIISSVIFSYISVETFVNFAIPEDFEYEKYNDKKIKEIWNKDNIERWMSTSDKISIILPKLFNIPDIKTFPFWNEFKKLEEIRNEIIHQKKTSNDQTFDSSIYNKLLSIDIFKYIKSSLKIIKFFYNYNNSHPYFPLGLGIAKHNVKEVENFRNNFEPMNLE